MFQDFLCIPGPCRQNQAIPKEKFGYAENDHIQITLLGTIKPGLTNVTYAADDKLHAGEIMIMQVEVEDIQQDIYSFLSPIFKSIKYRCVLLLKYHEKFKMAACKSRPSKVDSDHNVLSGFVVSYWIHTDLMSEPVEKAIKKIRNALNDTSDLKTIYDQIHSAIDSIQQGGTSRAHAERIIMGVMGREYPKGIDFKEILQYCTPVKYYKPTSGTRRRYAPAVRESNYILLHDYEDLWYCLQRSVQTRKYVQGESDMSILIYRLEEDP